MSDTCIAADPAPTRKAVEGIARIVVNVQLVRVVLQNSIGDIVLFEAYLVFLHEVRIELRPSIFHRSK